MIAEPRDDLDGDAEGDVAAGAADEIEVVGQLLGLELGLGLLGARGRTEGTERGSDDQEQDEQPRSTFHGGIMPQRRHASQKE